MAPAEYYYESLRRGNQATVRLLLESVLLEGDPRLFAGLKAAGERVNNALRQRTASVPSDPFSHARRHRPVGLIRAARNFIEADDPDGVFFVVSCAITEALRSYFTRRGYRHDYKLLYREITDKHPKVFALLQALHRAVDSRDRVDAMEELMRALYDDVGGLSYCGETERVPWQQAITFFSWFTTAPASLP